MTPRRFRKIRAALERRQPDLTVCMDNVHKDHNLSAVMRSADAIGILEVHAVSAGGEVKRHHMMSGGSRKWVGVRRHPDVHTAAEKLRASGHRLVAAHQSERSVDFRKLDYTHPTALLLGSELYGVSADGAELADEHVAIPMAGMVASLNVSVAAAVILYEIQRQREAAGLYERCRLDAERYERLLFEWCYPEIARHCRRRGHPYPPLDENGNLQENPGHRDRIGSG